MPEVQVLVFVVGTRAQLIKVAPVILECESRACEVKLLMTGQHKETMDDLVAEFGIRASPDFAMSSTERDSIWGLMAWLPGAFLGVRKFLRRWNKRGSNVFVLVHGDTLSTLVGAAAARSVGARVVHLESGLTSGKVLDPFPEEICRRLVFRMTDMAMCPSESAMQHMARYRNVECIDTQGNTILDAVRCALKALPIPAKASYAVVSLHRFQNLYDIGRLTALVETVVSVAEVMEVHFVLHPATRKRLSQLSLMQCLDQAPNVILHPRMGYVAFLSLAAASDCVLTDGGSNQEELAALGAPTIIMRPRTERADGLGANAIMEADVHEGVAAFVRDGKHRALRRNCMPLRADGPSRRIVDSVLAHAS